MKLAIRQADLVSDRQLIIDTLYRYLTSHSDGPRYDWLYRTNPHGEPRVWLGFDSTNQATVGILSAFPRRMNIDGREEGAWVLGDFCVNDQYRSLGPALQLQRACLMEVDAGTVNFCYDFPNPGATAIYNRLGLGPFRQMIRFAKPLRVDRKIGEFIRTPLIARGVSTAANLMLAFRDRRREYGRALTVSLHTGDFDEEFSVLASGASGRHGVCVQRLAEYLNWRFLASTYCRYEIMTARRDGCLVAYAVFTHADQDAVLADLFGSDDPVIISSLVSGVVGLLRKRGIVTVSVPMLESHPWGTLLHSLGFRPRETSPVVLYLAPHSQLKHAIHEGKDWFLMHGDRDS